MRAVNRRLVVAALRIHLVLLKRRLIIVGLLDAGHDLDVAGPWPQSLAVVATVEFGPLQFTEHSVHGVRRKSARHGRLEEIRQHPQRTVLGGRRTNVRDMLHPGLLTTRILCVLMAPCATDTHVLTPSAK